MAIDLPPQRFDHPFAGKVQIEYREHIDAWDDPCAKFGLGEYACAFVKNGVCYVYIVSWLPERINRSVLMRHEVAHCNGWPADHPR